MLNLSCLGEIMLISGDQGTSLGSLEFKENYRQIPSFIQSDSERFHSEQWPHRKDIITFFFPPQKNIAVCCFFVTCHPRYRCVGGGPQRRGGAGGVLVAAHLGLCEALHHRAVLRVALSAAALLFPAVPRHRIVVAAVITENAPAQPGVTSRAHTSMFFFSCFVSKDKHLLDYQCLYSKN